MVGSPPLTDLDSWLAAHASAAPPALRDRIWAYAGTDRDVAPNLPASLAAAAHRALSHVVNHPGDRSIALDLLAADGLITLALLAQAELAPGHLRRFAASLLDGPVAGQ